MDKEVLLSNINKVHTTEMGIDRIKKNLKLNNNDVVEFCKNKNCKINKCLPITCKEYSYTNKDERLFSLYSIISNASICPVVYEILEEIKRKYNFR